MIEVQQLIRFYKNELKKNPNCLASKVLLARNRDKLLSMKNYLLSK